MRVRAGRATARAGAVEDLCLTPHVKPDREFSGSDNVIAELRGLHGRPLRAPVPGCPPLSIEAIRWFREADKGGVFRAPALGAP